jgi:hypothetical protein
VYSASAIPSAYKSSGDSNWNQCSVEMKISIDSIKHKLDDWKNEPRYGRGVLKKSTQNEKRCTKEKKALSSLEVLVLRLGDLSRSWSTEKRKNIIKT